MKNALILTLLLSSSPAFACKISEANADAIRIAEASVYFANSIHTPLRLRLTKASLTKENQVVIESRLGDQCMLATYNVKIGNDCSADVSVVKLDGKCE